MPPGIFASISPGPIISVTLESSTLSKNIWGWLRSSIEKSTIQCHTSIFVSSFWRDEHPFTSFTSYFSQRYDLYIYTRIYDKYPFISYIYIYISNDIIYIHHKSQLFFADHQGIPRLPRFPCCLCRELIRSISSCKGRNARGSCGWRMNLPRWFINHGTI